MSGRVWQVVEARDRIKDIIDAAVEQGPQVIRRRGRDVVMVVSVQDWERRRSSLKDWLLDPKARTTDLLAGGGDELDIAGIALD
jgi:prevent-host-death family protein